MIEITVNMNTFTNNMNALGLHPVTYDVRELLVFNRDIRERTILHSGSVRSRRRERAPPVGIVAVQVRIGLIGISRSLNPQNVVSRGNFEVKYGQSVSWTDLADSRHAVLRSKLASTLRAEVRAAHEQVQQADAAYNQALAIAPDSNLGPEGVLALHQQGRVYATAVMTYSNAVMALLAYMETARGDAKDAASTSGTG
jgi:hypothetical protein